MSKLAIFTSPFAPAPSLHVPQMFSYTRDFLVQGATTSAPWLHVTQSGLPHATPSHRLAWGNMLLTVLPARSTTLMLKPIVAPILDMSSLILLASSPFSVCSTNKMDCCGGLFSAFLLAFVLLPAPFLIFNPRLRSCPTVGLLQDWGPTGPCGPLVRRCHLLSPGVSTQFGSQLPRHPLPIFT